DANLQITVNNPFPDATLMLWVDNQLTYSHPLHEGHKRHLMAWKRGSKETITIPIASGKHQLRVRVQSPSESYIDTKTVSANLSRNGEATLGIQFAGNPKIMTVD